MMRVLQSTVPLLLLAGILVFTPAASLLSSDVDEQIKRIVRSDGVDGYDIATVYTLDTATNTETRQTKRDIEAFVSDTSSHQGRFSLLLSSGERLTMSLHRRAIDTSGATLTELTKEGKTQTIQLSRRDCYFSGHLEKEAGHVSLSMCDGKLVGSISTAKRNYDIRTLSESISKRSADDVKQVLVTWQDRKEKSAEEFLTNGIEIRDDEEDFGDDAVEIPDGDDQDYRRSVEDGEVTIEIADYVDRHFIQELEDKFSITTNEEILDVLLIKWAGVANVLSDQERIGWNITLRLVDVVIMRTDPDWYQTSDKDKMIRRLKRVCKGTKKQKKKYDHLALHTGITKDRNVLGIAYVNGICLRKYRCAVSRASNTNFGVELHEIGHNMGLPHESSNKFCETDADTERGFMASFNDFIPECYKQRLAQTFRQSNHVCLFKNKFKDIIQDFSQTPSSCQTD